ncbi:MAG: hypothetical protein V1707_00440 [bacterium]
MIRALINYIRPFWSRPWAPVVALLLLDIAGYLYFFQNLVFGGGLLEFEDFRMHSNVALLGNNTDSLFNYQFGNNNYYYISLMPVINLLKLFPSTRIAQLVFFFALIVLSSYGIYRLVKILSKEENGDYPYWGAIAGGVGYAFSFYFFLKIVHWSILVGYALLPWVVICVYQMINQSRIWRKLLYSILLAVVLFFSNISPHYILINTLVIGWLLLYWLWVRYKKFLAVWWRFFVYVLAMVVVYLPLAVYLLVAMFGQEVELRAGWETATTASVLRFLAKRASFLNNLLGTSYYNFDQLFESSYPLLYVFVALGVGAVIVVMALKTRADSWKRIFGFAILFTIGLLFVSSVHEFGLETALANNAVFAKAGWVVKDSYFYMSIITFSAMVCYGYVVQRLARRSDVRVATSRFYNFVTKRSTIMAVLILLPLVSTTILANKEFFNLINGRRIPQEYETAVAYMNGRRSEIDQGARVLWLPSWDYSYYLDAQWSPAGGDDNQLLPHPSVWIAEGKVFIPMTATHGFLYHYLKAQIETGHADPAETAYLLRNLNIRFIVIDGNEVDRQRYDQHVLFFANNDRFQPVARFGQLTVYENKEADGYVNKLSKVGVYFGSFGSEFRKVIPTTGTVLFPEYFTIPEHMITSFKSYFNAVYYANGKGNDDFILALDTMRPYMIRPRRTTDGLVSQWLEDFLSSHLWIPYYMRFYGFDPGFASGRFLRTDEKKAIQQFMVSEMPTVNGRARVYLKTFRQPGKQAITLRGGVFGEGVLISTESKQSDFYWTYLGSYDAKNIAGQKLELINSNGFNAITDFAVVPEGLYQQKQKIVDEFLASLKKEKVAPVSESKIDYRILMPDNIVELKLGGTDQKQGLLKLAEPPDSNWRLKGQTDQLPVLMDFGNNYFLVDGETTEEVSRLVFAPVEIHSWWRRFTYYFLFYYLAVILLVSLREYLYGKYSTPSHPVV